MRYYAGTKGPIEFCLRLCAFPELHTLESFTPL